MSDPHQGQRHGVRQRHHVVQSQGRHQRHCQRGRLQRVCQAAGRHHPEERPGHQEPGRDPLGERVHIKSDAGCAGRGHRPVGGEGQ